VGIQEEVNNPNKVEKGDPQKENPQKPAPKLKTSDNQGDKAQVRVMLHDDGLQKKNQKVSERGEALGAQRPKNLSLTKKKNGLKK